MIELGYIRAMPTDPQEFYATFTAVLEVPIREGKNPHKII